MGPPDKREPKPSSDSFEYTYTNTILPSVKDLGYNKNNSTRLEVERGNNTNSMADNYTLMEIDNHCLGDKALPSTKSHKSLISSREVTPILA